MSSLAVDETINEPQQVSEFLYDLLKEKQGPLGIGFLGLDEKLSPIYPAVIIVTGPKEKSPHGTHIFIVGIECIINVYHAKLTSSTSTRSREDLNLVTAIENEVERDMTFGDRVVFAYVARTVPRVASRATGEQVIGTQMLIAVETRKGFPYGP